MARLSEKYNDSVLKIFQLLKLLSAGEVPFSDVINIFADEVDGVKSNSHVVLNKYLNTLKIFGLKVKKKKSMYYLINTPFSMELDEEELKAVLLLKSASELLPEGKAKRVLINLLMTLKYVSVRIQNPCCSRLRLMTILTSLFIFQNLRNVLMNVKPIVRKSRNLKFHMSQMMKSKQ